MRPDEWKGKAYLVLAGDLDVRLRRVRIRDFIAPHTLQTRPEVLLRVGTSALIQATGKHEMYFVPVEDRELSGTHAATASRS